MLQTYRLHWNLNMKRELYLEIVESETIAPREQAIDALFSHQWNTESPQTRTNLAAGKKRDPVQRQEEATKNERILSPNHLSIWSSEPMNWKLLQRKRHLFFADANGRRVGPFNQWFSSLSDLSCPLPPKSGACAFSRFARDFSSGEKGRGEFVSESSLRSKKVAWFSEWFRS